MLILFFLIVAAIILLRIRRISLIKEYAEVRLYCANVYMICEVIKTPSRLEAYTHWDYMAYINDPAYVGTKEEDYVRKYFWFYETGNKIHYREKSYDGILDNKKAIEEFLATKQN